MRRCIFGASIDGVAEQRSQFACDAAPLAASRKQADDLCERRARQRNVADDLLQFLLNRQSRCFTGNGKSPVFEKTTDFRSHVVEFRRKFLVEHGEDGAHFLVPPECSK